MPFEKRKLSQTELKLLFAILPEEKPAYKKYHYRLTELFVIGNGRFGSNNLILGNLSDEPDTTLPSSPVFSFGEIVFSGKKFEVIIHEEEEEKIEIELPDVSEFGSFSQPVFDSINSIAFYSPLEANKKYEPNRKVELINGEFYLSFIFNIKKIIVTDLKNGYNALIPVSNYYNELMFVKNIRDPKTALKPQLLFNEIEKYSDRDLAEAFIYYNKLFRRVNLNIIQKTVNPPVKEGFFKKLFRGNQE